MSALAELRKLFRYRMLIQSLVGRELKARYRGSILGFFWSFVNPLLLLLTYGVVFTYMMPGVRGPDVEPYFLFLVLRIGLSPAALLLPLPLLVQLVLTLGIALCVSALTVHFRDIQSILSHVLHLWFFATPVLYSYAGRQGRLKDLLRLNPMTHLIVSYQEMLFRGEFHHWRSLAATAVVAVLVFALGSFLFDRLRDTLAEEV